MTDESRPISIRRDFSLIAGERVLGKDLPALKRSLREILEDDLVVPGGLDYVETMNCNPVGRPHLGNLFTVVKGDIFCRILGVTPGYYVNDLGLNFCKFLYNSRAFPNEDIEKLYVIYDPTDQELGPLRRELFENYPEDGVRLRNEALKLIAEESRRFRLKDPVLYYESSYSNEVKSFLKRGTPSEKGLLCEGVQIATSDGIPLYICGDHHYRKEIDSSFNSKLICLGRDHTTYQKNLNTLTLKPWKVCFSPMVYFKGQKMSKRKRTCLYLKDVHSMLSEGNELREEDVMRYLKLFVIKYEKRDTLEVEQILRESVNISEYLRLVERREYSSDEVSRSLESLEEWEVDDCLKVWANLREICQYFIGKLEINKLYKFLEHLHFMKKSVKTQVIHRALLDKFLDRLGL